MKCQDCGQEMLEAESCTKGWLMVQFSSAQLLAPRNTTYFDNNTRCHDCGILNKPGNIHHFGCCMERCPMCGGQLISCGCFGKHDIEPLTIEEVRQELK